MWRDCRSWLGVSTDQAERGAAGWYDTDPGSALTVRGGRARSAETDFGL